jgi:hypothetical protein
VTLPRDPTCGRKLYSPRHGCALREAEQQVESEGERDDEQRPAEHLVVATQAEAGNDRQAEAAEVEIGGDRHGGDDLEHRGAQAAEQERQAEGHLDAPEHLPLGHADAAGRVGDAPVDRLDARVSAREQRRDREDDEGDQRRLGPTRHAEQQHEQHEQAERRNRAGRAGDRDGDFAAAAGVADPPAEWHRDRDGDEHRHESGEQMLAEQPEQGGVAAPLARAEDPGERIQQIAHAALPSTRARRVVACSHGVSTRPSSCRARSMTSAMMTTASTPANTSAMMRRCRPFVNR